MARKTVGAFKIVGTMGSKRVFSEQQPGSLGFPLDDLAGTIAGIRRRIDRGFPAFLPMNGQSVVFEQWQCDQNRNWKLVASKTHRFRLNANIGFPVKQRVQNAKAAAAAKASPKKPARRSAPKAPPPNPKQRRSLFDDDWQPSIDQ